MGRVLHRLERTALHVVGKVATEAPSPSEGTFNNDSEAGPANCQSPPTSSCSISALPYVLVLGRLWASCLLAKSSLFFVLQLVIGIGEKLC